MTTVTSVSTTTTTPLPQQSWKTHESSYLWGAGPREDIAVNTPQAIDSSTYVYAPGDSCNVISAQDGIHLLWLHHIQANEVSVHPTRNGKVQVHYRKTPILRMVGVNLIRTEDGCFSVDHWLS